MLLTLPYSKLYKRQLMNFSKKLLLFIIINRVIPTLNERQAKIHLATETQSMGCEWISKKHQLSGINRQTIAAGIKETKQETASTLEDGWIRHKGGGRKNEFDKSPQHITGNQGNCNSSHDGRPENPLIWCSMSIRKVKETLHSRGYEIRHETIRKCLQRLGFSLQPNKKTKG